MTTNNSTATELTAAAPRTPIGPLLFCAALMVVGLTFIGIVAWRYAHPQASDSSQSNMEADAIAYIRLTKKAPLSEPLADILAKAETMHYDSNVHPLVGKPAPDFSRPDVDGNQWALKDATAKGPVVLVIYLGYQCNHCVSQLFDIKQDYEKFRELGAEVVALSPDAASHTKAKYAEYSPFPFPVLSDRDCSIAEAYCVYTPAKDGKREDLQHGTFVIDQTGIVRWAAFGNSPFGHNETLLYEVAKITGRIRK